MNKYFLPIYHSKLKPWIKWWIDKRLLNHNEEDKNLIPYSDNYYTRAKVYLEVTINKPTITVTNTKTNGTNYFWWSIPITNGKTYIIKYDSLDYTIGYFNYIFYNFSNSEVTRIQSLGTFIKVDTNLKSVEVEATGNYINVGVLVDARSTVTVENLQLLEK